MISTFKIHLIDISSNLVGDKDDFMLFHAKYICCEVALHIKQGRIYPLFSYIRKSISYIFTSTCDNGENARSLSHKAGKLVQFMYDVVHKFLPFLSALFCSN